MRQKEKETVQRPDGNSETYTDESTAGRHSAENGTSDSDWGKLCRVVQLSDLERIKQFLR